MIEKDIILLFLKMVAVLAWISIGILYLFSNFLEWRNKESYLRKDNAE